MNKSDLAGLLGGALALCLSVGAASAQTYALVQGLDKFDGSTAAWHLLETNGFVVSGPAFKQIFEPYLDDSIPVFITTDSAWHTYHILLNKGIRELESARKPAPADFSPPLPSASFFKNATGPKFPGRIFPSGLDLFVALPSLRSPAAERALRAAEGGAVLEAMRTADGGLLPDTLRGRALRLLATLQEPLPVRLGPALRSEAWADAQLWAQLGAWVEEEHAGASHGAARADEGEIDKSAAGVVAPYPDFFAGLGKIALDTAVDFEKAGIAEPFDAKTAARELFECIAWQEGLGEKSRQASERETRLMAQCGQFILRFMAPHQAEIDNDPLVSQKLLNDLEILARRCSTQTAPAEADRQVLLNFFQERQTVPKMLRDFVPVCDKLAELARKHKEAVALTDDDTKWMGDYGATLARFQFHAGASADPPSDDFPIVNRVQADPAGKGVFYAGLGRPQALYIILPAGGRLRLYRGAVMTYREFVRANADPLDDDSWRAIARTGEVPPPPAFTRSFYTERDAAELIKTFASLSTDSQGYKEIAESLEELQSRVTDRDLPELIAALGKNQSGTEEPVSDGLASAISKLHWEPRQRELLALLEKDDGQGAQTVAPILLGQPEGLDAVFLSTNFDHAPARARRVYCALLSRLPQSVQTRAALLRALSDPAPAVRWEAAAVLGAAWSDAAQKTAPLLDRVTDENQFVAAAAAAALGQIRATNAAPALLTNLEQRLQRPAPSPAELRKQREAVQDFPLNFPAAPPRAAPSARMPFEAPRMRRFAGGFPMRSDDSPAEDALIESLGALHYYPAAERILGLLDGAHAVSAAKALKQLAPDKLLLRLVAEARDKKADPSSRDTALLLLAMPPSKAPAADLIPLLDDTTVVPKARPMPGREWRICDRAAETIGALLGQPVKIMPIQTVDQRDLQIDQIRQAVKAAY